MTTLAVVGAQWGDEGKGKVVDVLAAEADLVARFAGGNNAGHTLVVDGKKIVTHLVPSGCTYPGTRCLLGAGMVIDPEVLQAGVIGWGDRFKFGAGDEHRQAVGERALAVLPTSFQHIRA